MSSQTTFDKYSELTYVELEAAARQDRHPTPIYMHIDEWRNFLITIPTPPTNFQFKPETKTKNGRTIVTEMNGVPIGYYIK